MFVVNMIENAFFFYHYSLLYLYDLNLDCLIPNKIIHIHDKKKKKEKRVIICCP